jgi:serine protease Do
MAILDEVQAHIARLAEGAGPSVVGIGQRWGAGSGIVLGNGRVLTNAHNVRGGQVMVTFADGRTAEGSVAGHDIDADLAVIEADTGEAPALPWAAGTPAGIGMPVFALSNPGGRGLRVTFGFVSGVERTFRGPRGLRITGSLEHTAPLLPGSSGGPILDAGGQLLGINTNRLGEGFYLAIPADDALRGRADALARGQSAAPPRLGIVVAPGHVARRLRRAVGLPEADGLLIREVTEASPAERAGLAQGDLIVAAGGRPVRTIDDLFGALQAARGGTIELSVIRGTDERSIQVVLGENGQPGAASA